MAKNTICLWYDKDAEAAARFYAETFPDSVVGAALLDIKPAHRTLDPLRQKGPRCHGGVTLGRFSTVSPRVRRDAIRFNRWLTRWA